MKSFILFKLKYKAVFPNVPVAPGIEMAISCPSSRYYVTQLPILNLSVKIGLVSLSPAANCMALQHNTCCNNSNPVNLLVALQKKGMVYETGKFFKKSHSGEILTIPEEVLGKNCLQIIWPSCSGKVLIRRKSCR